MDLLNFICLDNFHAVGNTALESILLETLFLNQLHEFSLFFLNWISYFF